MIKKINKFKRRILNKLKIRSKIKGRITLKKNKILNKSEYSLACRISDIFTAISESAGDVVISPPKGGVFWSEAKKGLQPFDLYLRKNKSEIEHSFLMNARFRDFPTIAYEHPQYTPTPDFWVRRYVRLVNAMPKKWRIRVPARFGEIGWNVGGYPVNRWTSVNQERMNTIHLAGITTYLQQQSYPRILEIGGGSGEMGYAFSKALPRATWYDCDLLGCLFYSAIHLAIMLPKKQHYIYVGNLSLPSHVDQNLILRSPENAAKIKNAIVYIPNFLMDDFTDHLKIHFAYNTYSFGEMPSSAVEHYTHLLAKFLKDEGVLYEQNGYFPERGGDNLETVLAREFKSIPLPPLLDGRHLLNGPARLWSNNDIANKLLKLSNHDETLEIISSFNDLEDKVDIEFTPEAWQRLDEVLV